MTFTFFNSDKVRIFPCARRGSFTDSEQKVKIYDAESRLTTESNLTRLFGLAFNKDSYIIDTTPIAGVQNGQLWRLVIKGYYFEVETTLTRIDYFVIGLEETNSIPSTRLGVLARDDQKNLGQDSAATRVDIINVNTLESECRAICAVSFDAGDTELSLDSSFCHWVSTTDTLDSLNARYLNSSLDSEINNLKAADIQILADARDYAAGLASNYEAAGSINALKNNELASIKGRLNIIEGSGEGSIIKAITDAKAYADDVEADAKQHSDNQLSAAIGPIEAAIDAIKEKDSTQDDEIAKIDQKLDIAVYEAYIVNKTMSDDDLKAYVETTANDAKAAALESAAATAQDKVNSLAAGAVKANTDNISAINTNYKKADTDLDNKITALRNEIGNLTSVMNFRGAVDAETDITDPIEGDVIIIKSTGVEMIYSGVDWVEIGTTSAPITAITAIEARLAAIEDPETGSIAVAKAYTDECVKGCLSYSDQAKDYAITYTNAQLNNFQATIQEISETAILASNEASAANAAASTANSLVTGIQDKLNEYETLSAQQTGLIEANTSNIAALSEQCAQFNTDLQDGTLLITNLATSVSFIELNYLKSADADKNYIKKTALGGAIGVYAVAFDVSRCNTSDLEATFIQAISNPIIFIPGCTTLPEASGYTWQDAAGTQITEDSINKNLILYLTKV